MSLVTCPQCQKPLRIGREGSAFRCPQCKAVVPETIPGPPPLPPADAGRDGLAPMTVREPRGPGPGMAPNPKGREQEPRQVKSGKLADAVALLFCPFFFAVLPLVIYYEQLNVPPVFLFAWFASLGLGGCVASVISRVRGRRPVVGFALGMVLGPILSLLLLLLDPGDPAGKGLRRCPQCAEWIQPAALVCKHCGSQQDYQPPD